ncbi:Immunity-related GTPase family Q protein [Camelus dromedarius]|uniref:Immunity-related GTPase family Q protein n=1 Tax=Camelus dromedarius TaxID=9838 RepID=A0A5N4DT74_CAMDR|nr:Immunity-related GTPase family Q protein [Camelus dromedarius]
MVEQEFRDVKEDVSWEEADCRSSDGCEELERLRRRCGARRGAAEVTRPPATRSDGFEVLGAAELEAVREARDRGLEAALRGFAPPGRTGQRRLDLAVAGVLAERTRFPGSVTRAEVEASLGSWAGDGTDRGAALGRSPSCARVAAGGHRGWLPPSHGVLLQALDEMRADAEAVLAPQVPAQ